MKNFTNLQIFFQHIATFQVMILIGAILAIIAEYLPYAMVRRLRKRHVLLMGFAFVGLLLITLSGVYIGVFFPPSQLWEMRLYALISVYFASDFGLYYMFDYVSHLNGHKKIKDEPTTG